MRFERDDWMVADKELMKSAGRWWAPWVAGLAMEAALLYGGWFLASQLAPPYSGLVNSLLLVRVVMGSIGAWGWATSTPEPQFWDFKARWAMQFFPAAMLSHSRYKACEKFICKLASERPERMELAAEQEEYYMKGSCKHDLGFARREMACWASAMRECKNRWARQQHEEQMKSPQAREKALEEMGLGKALLPKSLRSLDKMEISCHAAMPSSVDGGNSGSKRL